MIVVMYQLLMMLMLLPHQIEAIVEKLLLLMSILLQLQLRRLTILLGEGIELLL